jgi:adenylyltransferase/sulfurtransferase
LHYNAEVPVIRLPALMAYYTGNANGFSVEGTTALEAVRAAAALYPALQTHLFDQKNRLRRHVNLFINDTHVRDLDGFETTVSDSDVVRILPSISGG